MCQRSHRRARRQHPYDRGWSRDWIAVAREAPGVELVAVHQVRCVAGRQQDKRAVWERIQLIDGCQLHLVALIVMIADSLTMQRCVDRIDRWRRGPGKIGICGGPVGAECDEALALALSAWAVAGGERGSLVEKEQRGVLASWHRRSGAPLEVEHADDPAPALVLPQQMIASVVQAAAVAHECAARLIRDDLAERIDPILEGHAASLLAWPIDG